MAIAQDISLDAPLDHTKDTFAVGNARLLTVARQEFRVDVRRGTGTGVPLLMLSGIGAGLELFQPLVDAIDPAIEVIRVDTPGVGGSPAGPRPYAFHELAWMVSRLL